MMCTSRAAELASPPPTLAEICTSAAERPHTIYSREPSATARHAHAGLDSDGSNDGGLIALR